MQLLFRTYPILLLLLAVITFGSALPNQILPQSVHSRGFSPDFRHAHHDLNRTALLSKRDLDRNRYAVTQYLGLGWFCYFNLLDIVTPLVQIAVQDMEHFFSTVLSMAGDIWANEPAQTWRGARYGEIILEMSSSAPIPWEWIHGYLIGAVCQSFLSDAPLVPISGTGVASYYSHMHSILLSD